MSDFNIQFEEQDQSITLEFEQIGGGAVKSVNGKTGAVVLDAGDLEYDDSETYSSGTVGDALSDLKEDISELSSIPTTVRQAMLTLFESAAYAETGLTDEIAVVESWAEEVTSLALNQTAISISGSGTVQLVATTVPAGKTVTWSSSDDTIATVSASGLVTGVSNGSVTITAACGDKRATCTATVSGFATLVSISAVYTQSGTVYDTDSLDSLKDDLVVTAHYSDSSTQTVTTYTLSGTLTEGTSTITVTYSGKTATFTVTVTRAGKWSYSISELTKVTGTIGNKSGATCGIALVTGGSNNVHRRSFVVDSGETSMAVASSDQEITSQTSNYYPVKVPVGATSVTCSITPDTQMIQILTRQLNNGVYSSYTTVGPTGYNVGPITKTFEPAPDNVYVCITTKYNSAGASYPVEPTAFNIEFA